MERRVNKTMTIGLNMLDEIETRMKTEGISFSELMRRAASLYLTNGAQPDSKDSEQLEHKPETSSLSDMLNDSDFAVK